MINKVILKYFFISFQSLSRYRNIDLQDHNNSGSYLKMQVGKENK